MLATSYKRKLTISNNSRHFEKNDLIGALHTVLLCSSSGLDMKDNKCVETAYPHGGRHGIPEDLTLVIMAYNGEQHNTQGFYSCISNGRRNTDGFTSSSPLFEKQIKINLPSLLSCFYMNLIHLTMGVMQLSAVANKETQIKHTAGKK